MRKKVFLVWSGERGHRIALALHDWLPLVIPQLKPYMAPEGVEKGSRWLLEISRELERTFVGILCITADSAGSPWLNFEAGALSKFVNTGRVVPFLFDLEPSQLRGPLSQFQCAKYEKSDVKRMVESLSRVYADDGLSDKQLSVLFRRWWPRLKARLDAVDSKPCTTLAQPRLLTLEILCEHLREIKKQMLSDGRLPAFVIGSGRKGAICAAILATYLGRLPLKVITEADPVIFRDANLKNKDILVVEYMRHTGGTFRKIKEALRRAGAGKIRSFALCCHPTCIKSRDRRPEYHRLRVETAPFLDQV